LRVARRMSFTTWSAAAFVVTAVFLTSTSIGGQAEPQALRYAITTNCSLGDVADPTSFLRRKISSVLKALG
jgi:hypothetical protein